MIESDRYVVLGCVMVAASFVAERGVGFATGFFIFCTVVLAMESIVHRLNARQKEKERLGILPKPSKGLRRVNAEGKAELVPWSAIDRVLWSEPDWGYGWDGSSPYWMLRGEGVDMERDDEPRTAATFAANLPGFDPQVVKKAIASGLFDPDKDGCFVCWTRSGGSVTCQTPGEGLQGATSPQEKRP